MNAHITLNGRHARNRAGTWLRPLHLAIGLGSFWLQFQAAGLGFRIPNQDAEAIGRGNAFIATADNPSAIYYNPAGITQIPGTELRFGTHNLAINSEYESLDGNSHAESKSEIATVPEFYATWSPENLPISLGAGVYAPFGLGLEWPTDTPFRTLAQQGRLTYITFNPVIAWKILPNLSIAAGPTVNYSKVDLRQGIALPGDEFVFQGDGWAFGASAGLLWKPFEKWSVGLTYHSPTRIDFSGTSEAKPYGPPQDTTAALSFPQWAGAGIAFRPSPEWNIEAYVDWTDWDTLKTVTFKMPTGDMTRNFFWQSSFLTGIGATRYFESGWYVSAGYFFSQNSTSEDYFNPIVPDTDLHVGSIGFGYKGSHWRLALAGQLIGGDWRTVETSQSSSLIGESANGKYRWFNQSINFSVGYHF